MDLMDKRFDRVVIWGYPLHSHTHSYIHHAFKKAFERLGYRTAWHTDNDDLEGEEFGRTLFIATGQQEHKIPLNPSSYYVLHNADISKYLECGCKVLSIQTITKGAPEDESSIRFNPYTLLCRRADADCLYFPWATDLLPEEIDVDAPFVVRDDKYCIWVGTFGDSKGLYQNGTELNPYMEEAGKCGIRTVFVDPWGKPVSFEENRRLVREAYLAPAILGPWQIENELIPCRIFKNISYGGIGITNSAAVNALFSGAVAYHRDPVQLFYKSVEKVSAPDSREIRFLRNEVRTKHTYVNRISDILSCLP